MDLGVALFAAGLRIAERVVVGWVRDGRAQVRVSEADKQIAREAKREAERLRLRVEDLERSTHAVLNDLLLRSADICRAGHGRRSALILDYDPKDAASSESLLTGLRTRIEHIERDHRASQQDPGPNLPADLPPGMSWSNGDSAPSGGVTPSVVLEPDVQPKSASMIQDLQERVRRAEDDRQ